MKVAIFGATGATGKLLTERCLARGYEVRVLARRADFDYADRVEMVRGDARDAGAVRRTVEGVDCVLTALGAPNLGRSDLLEVAVPLIVGAMRECGVRRIVALGSAGAVGDSLKKQSAWRRWFVQKIVYKTVLKWPVRAQISQWKTLSASGLEWTMVMPPMLTNGRGREVWRVDGEALPRGGSRIAREDVADFMVAQVEGREWVGKGVYVAW